MIGIVLAGVASLHVTDLNMKRVNVPEINCQKKQYM